MAKDRSRKILKEIAALREDVLLRFDRLEERLGDHRTAPSPDSALPSSVQDIVTDPETSAGATGEPAAAAVPGTPPALPKGEMRVVVSPLRDLSLAQVVESSLARSEGVKQATLRELRGDSATIDVRAEEDFSLLESLRQHLPVAFDVIASDRQSVTIALVQPREQSQGSTVAPGSQ